MSKSVDLPALPETERPLLLRTGFGAEDAWAALVADFHRATMDFGDEEPSDFVAIVDDPVYRDLSAAEIIALMPADGPHGYLVVADETAIKDAEHPLLLIDLLDDPGREFRSVPDGLCLIVANLDVGNRDLVEYADSVDDDGVYRNGG
ncbi:DUF6924 domain-containing protein [Kutzneria sp. CA-103260]|uniref:DUF6924 domain-containing protein n=1 Tax=Kutzneria sp. CA-103260 TaxID=2802641 RepID=UPI001BAAEEEC|nr:hypothetical protein [Kutzneria sp. CA-103260]QUQ72448.1 hypothetical protein JJ691_102370 [Kutzneria sp. CA-103260]